MVFLSLVLYLLMALVLVDDNLVLDPPDLPVNHASSGLLVVGMERRGILDWVDHGSNTDGARGGGRDAAVGLLLLLLLLLLTAPQSRLGSGLEELRKPDGKLVCSDSLQTGKNNFIIFKMLRDSKML